jgi:smoothened
MASFVFTPSTVEIWGRFFRRKFGQKIEEPLKLQKHKVIAQAFAKRKEFQNQGRLSISFHNSHTDPVGLKFDMNSAVGSHDFSSTWANNLPRFVNRRYALTGCPSSSSHGHRRNSIDSISFSVRHVSVESRRNSNDSQVSVKIAEMKTKVASRSRGSKSKSRSSRHRRDFSSRRYSRKESSTSMESQIIAAMAQKNSHHSTATTAEMGGGMLVPIGAKRRSGISALDPQQINELMAKNKLLLPFLTTSDDEKSSIASFNVQDSKLEVFLKQIGLSEHRIVENKFSEDINGDDGDSIEMQVRNPFSMELSDVSSKENIAAAGRNSKNSNRSIGSKKSLKTGNSSRLRKTRKSSRSIAKTANSLAITNGSGRFKVDKKSKDKEKLHNSQDGSFNSMAMNGNLQGSFSGRSDVGIQTDHPSMSSMEFAERMMKQDREDEEDEPMESHKLLPKRVSLSAATKRRDTNENLLSESEKLKLLLLPSK